MLHIHHSNRLEALRDTLLRQLDAAQPDVFSVEQVIVPSAALRRDLSLAIADARGICTNVHFDFLAQWLWRQVARVVPGVGDESPFAADALVWRVHAAFDDAAFVAGQSRLQAYLQDADALMRYELASQAAGLLEQYVTYRPAWLQAWRDGDRGAPADADTAWQAALWQRLEAELGTHAPHPAEAFVAALQRGGVQQAQRAGLPARLHVFALPAIAPQHLHLLQQLAQHLDVQLYVLNPCREYWFDLVGRRRLSRLAAQGRATGLEEEGNPLLASWGKQAQVMLDALLDAGGSDDADFVPAPGTHLLAQLQNTLLELQPVAPGSLECAEGDRSIELHVCHSLTRELEVLHDHLLGLFAADHRLRPGDILVVTPDLEAAAPLIDAVFGTAPKERALPYALCGARRSRANALARCLLELLALATSRCRASEVFGLLQQPPVARRFGLDDDALARVHAWLREAGFHWALDATQRARLDLPADPRHTLDDALQRLFLGYALPCAHAEPFDARLGAGDAEGTEALALGALWRYATTLRRTLDLLLEPRLPEAWATLLAGLIDDFLAADDAALDDLRELRQTVDRLADDMRRGGVARPLPLPVVRAALQQRIDAGGGGGAAGGSINFASMSSLRGLPFTVVCAVGLNDGTFPATRRPLEFDLIANHPQRGDRDARNDDRGLMLDLLLAARGSLYLSHTGRSQRDNTPLPPSVLVAELLDLLVPAIASDPADAASRAQARQRLVVEHPLQPFALPAFDTQGEPRLRSFDRELAAALRRSLAAPAMPQTLPMWRDEDEEDEDADPGLPTPFFDTPLAPAGPEWRQVSLAQLQAFLRNPSRLLLRRRLGLDLAYAAEELQDDEPLLPDAAASRALMRRLLPLLLDGADPGTLPALARAGGEWPAGCVGDAALQTRLQSLQLLATRLRQALAEPVLPPRALALRADLDGEALQLQADFADLRASGLLRWRDGEARATDYLDAWLAHLALCATAPAGVALRTRWLGADGEFSFAPCVDAAAHLRQLLALYRQGLDRPLRFFPKSAWEFVTAGLPAARNAWQVTPYHPYAEGADPAYMLALRGVDEPLDDEFQRLAHAVFDPLLAHLQEPPP